MQETKLRNITPCPVCGGGVVLRRNAAKLFQIRCPNCGARTAWKRKPDAIITWYNMVIAYMKNAGKFDMKEE